MQTIPCLIPDNTLRSVYHFSGYFLATMGRQTVHEDRAGLGAFHQGSVDDVSRKRLLADRLLLLLAHGGPDVSVNYIGSIDSLGGISDNAHVRVRLRALQDLRVGLIAFGTCKRQVKTKSVRRI